MASEASRYDVAAPAAGDRVTATVEGRLWGAFQAVMEARGGGQGVERQGRLAYPPRRVREIDKALAHSLPGPSVCLPSLGNPDLYCLRLRPSATARAAQEASAANPSQGATNPNLLTDTMRPPTGTGERGSTITR